MANNCLIEFDRNEFGTYFTGQQLTGKVIFTLNKSKSFKGIKLQVNGYAQCQWRERRGRKTPVYKKNLKKKHIFHGHEDYIASTTFLVGSDMSQSFSIDSGTHTYSFACPIPINCPSSYEGTYGHIRYIVKVTFIRQGSSNRSYTKGFTVLRLLDLNRESALLKAPACNDSFERFCFLNSKAVNLRVDVTQTGFVPGQMILVSCQVNNESKAAVKNLLITLNLRATYISDTPSMHTTYEKLCLSKKYCGAVAHQTTKNFAEIMRVPATPPTCDYLSKIVRISYEICVKAIMSHFMSDPKCVIPITIGNVPLTMPESETETTQIDDIPTTSACAMQSPAEDDQNVLSEETEVEYELPPPSYEEAMFMSANINDVEANEESENVRFTPRFPVYDVDNIVMANAMAQTPAPNPPLKRRKRRNVKTMASEPNITKERTPRESPVEI